MVRLTLMAVDVYTEGSGIGCVLGWKTGAVCPAMGKVTQKSAFD